MSSNIFKLNHWQRILRNRKRGYMRPKATRDAFIDRLKRKCTGAEHAGLVNRVKCAVSTTTSVPNNWEPVVFARVGQPSGFVERSATTTSLSVDTTWEVGIDGTISTGMESIISTGTGGLDATTHFSEYYKLRSIDWGTICTSKIETQYLGLQSPSSWRASDDSSATDYIIYSTQIYTGSAEDWGVLVDTGSKNYINGLNRVLKRNQIRRNLLCSPPTKRQLPDYSSVTPAELTALGLLRELLKPDEWRKYLKYGFVLVEGLTGLTYQIFRGRQHVIVLLRGKRVAELCLACQPFIPKTDCVIARKVMLESDELGFWWEANIRACKWPADYKPGINELLQLAKGDCIDAGSRITINA